LTDEPLDLLRQSRQSVLDLRTQQDLHPVVGNLHPQFSGRARRIASELGQGRADAALRTLALEDDGIEDLNLMELVTLGLKEPPPLINGRFRHRVVVLREGRRSGSI
jgi:hypothetical protein